ncbi:Ribosomal biogenesis, methyltransferase, EMG1/NEP1, partial [mine drainage metagenome]
ESILNKVGQLELFIHTREDKVITVNKETRIPRSFNRFSGLIEDLFEKRKIQSGRVTLLEMIDSTLMDFIFSRGMANVRVFSPAGKKSTVSEAVGDEVATTMIIGGFSGGNFRSNLDDLGNQFSIYPEELTIWTVAMEAICTYERVHGIMQ